MRRPRPLFDEGRLLCRSDVNGDSDSSDGDDGQGNPELSDGEPEEADAMSRAATQEVDVDSDPDVSTAPPEDERAASLDARKDDQDFMKTADLPDLTGMYPLPSFIDRRYTPARALFTLKKLARNIHTLLDEKNLGAGAQKKRVDWLKDLKRFEAKMKAELPFTIALVGGTGVGKSSLTNAILGMDICPTSSMNACTSVVTEIKWQAEEGARAEIVFLQKDEWRKELEALRSDLLDPYGKCLCTSDSSSAYPEAAFAWSRLNAVYPLHGMSGDWSSRFQSLSLEELMDEGIARTHLGTTKIVSALTSDQFQKAIRPYMDARGETVPDSEVLAQEDDTPKRPGPRKARTQQLAPLIKRVTIYVKADFLAGGTLVDLPGVQDANVARSKIASKFLEKADALFVVTDQNRALADKTAQDLFKKSFKRQLALDGSFDRLSFVSTRADSISEVKDLIPELPHLAEELEPLQEEMRQLQREHEAALVGKQRADNEVRLAKQTEGQIRTTVGELEKRSRSPHGSDNSTETKPTTRSLTRVSAARKSANKKITGTTDALAKSAFESETRTTRIELAKAEAEVAAWSTELQRADFEVLKSNNRIREVQRDLTTVAALARNQYTRSKLRDQFNQLQELADMEAAEEEEGDDWDPDQPRKDFSSTRLPVFTTSAQAYRSLVREGASSSTCFNDIEQTGIPSLRRHIRTLIRFPQHEHALEALQYGRHLLESIRLFVKVGKGKGHGLAELEANFESKIKSKSKELEELARLAQRRHDGELSKLERELRDAAHGVSQKTEQTIDELMDRIRVPTFRAITKRDGCFSNKNAEYNFNESLAEPFMDSLTDLWSATFTDRDEPDVFKTFESEAARAVDLFMTDLAESAASTSSTQLAEIAEKSKKAIEHELKMTVNARRANAAAAQRSATRTVESTLQNTLLDAYAAAAGESGKGTLIRMKKGLHDFIADHPSFHAGAIAEIMSQLRQYDYEIARDLQTVVERVSKVLKSNYSTLFDKLDPADRRTYALRSRIYSAAGKLLEEVEEMAQTMLPPPQSVMQDEAGDVSDAESDSDPEDEDEDLGAVDEDLDAVAEADEDAEMEMEMDNEGSAIEKLLDHESSEDEDWLYCK